ncbi:MAG: hypothetical protein ABJQ34_16060 [Paracoccaceae bacterium]
MRLTDLIPSLRSRSQSLQMAADGVMELQPLRQGMPILNQSDPNVPLAIECPETTAEDRARDAHQSKGQFLARQERWEDIANLMSEADSTLAKTGGGMPIAELVAYGARADVVSAVEHALLDGNSDNDAALLGGIEALESVLSDHPDCPWTAMNVAQAHIDLAWAWRGTGWDREVPERNRAVFTAHFDRASDILSDIDPKFTGSPMLASCIASLCTSQPRNPQQIAVAFEDLIDLDPRNARAMRHFGVQMLPRCHGDYEALELAARRNAGRTYDIWGAGGYTWVMLDAIATDFEACARVDYDFFVDGLRDIFKHTRDQYIVNLLAAYCANTMQANVSADADIKTMRTRIAQNANWIVREHMCELHPLIWAHAARGFDNGLRVSCPRRFAQAGLADAYRSLTEMFQKELEAGQRIIFTSDGLEPLTT